jgi:peptidyl-prolyl cis-trans isomerase A (cyclophilin A)
MKLALTAFMLCLAVSAQTKDKAAPAPAKAATPAPATKAAPAPAKAATPAPTAKAPAAKAAAVDLTKPDTIKGKAPDIFIARLETTKGNIDIRVQRNWAPNGADRFYNLVRAGFYDNIYFFRVISGFMAQFGISSKPALSRVWSDRDMLDDRVIASNKRGFITYAQTRAPNSRSTQLFINTGSNERLDSQRFAPFGEVVEGMNVVDSIYSGYNEQPEQDRISLEGEAYLNRYFPRLDKIIKATILQVVE